MLTTLALCALAAFALLLAVVATRPAAFRIARSTTVSAPAEAVFARLHDFRRWVEWSPYETADPTLVRRYEGPAHGVGAVYHYAGRRAGEGRMTVTASVPNERLVVRAEFIRPFTATNRIEFTLVPAPDGVAVTWAMSGENSFVARAFGLFVNVERMVGGDFERGLAALKRAAEADAAASVGV